MKKYTHIGVYGSTAVRFFSSISDPALFYAITLGSFLCLIINGIKRNLIRTF